MADHRLKYLLKEANISLNRLAKLMGNRNETYLHLILSKKFPLTPSMSRRIGKALLCLQVQRQEAIEKALRILNRNIIDQNKKKLIRFPKRESRI